MKHCLFISIIIIFLSSHPMTWTAYSECSQNGCSLNGAWILASEQGPTNNNGMFHFIGDQNGNIIEDSMFSNDYYGYPHGSYEISANDNFNFTVYDIHLKVG